MSQSPLDALLRTVSETLGSEPLNERVRPVLEGFLEQFELVPRKEFEAQLAALSRLEQTVAELEARIAELERRG